MARTRKLQTKVCTVTGLETSLNNFYKNQNHLKAVDNFRRTTGANKTDIISIFWDAGTQTAFCVPTLNF